MGVEGEPFTDPLKLLVGVEGELFDAPINPLKLLIKVKINLSK